MAPISNVPRTERGRLRTRRRVAATVAAIGVVGALTAACGGGSSSSASAPETTPITFSLDYQIDGLHAPLFVAQDKGYYRKNGLDVTINPSGGSRDAITRVAAGQAQLGIASASTVVEALANQDVKLTVVGVLLQHSTQATAALKSSGITTPQDLRGKTVGDAPATSEHAFFPAFLGANGMKPSDVHNVSLSPSSITPTLLAGKVAAVNNFIQTFAKVADKLSLIPWYKYGVDTYGSTIIVNTDYLKSHGDAVRRFLAATYHGLTDTISNPTEAGSIVAKAARSDPDFYIAEIKVLRPFWELKGASRSEYGRMTDAGWRAVQQLNLKYAGQTKKVDLSKIYTNDYLATG